MVEQEAQKEILDVGKLLHSWYVPAFTGSFHNPLPLVPSGIRPDAHIVPQGFHILLQLASHALCHPARPVEQGSIITNTHLY